MWAHEASLAPVELHPLLRWRMRRAEDSAWAREARPFVDAVLREVEAAGPLRVADLPDPGARSGPWWGWSDGKRALEWLFAVGRVAVAQRRGFERVYDLAERVLPGDVLAAPTPPEEEARRALLRLAARALGVATDADLADYFRQQLTAVRPVLATLVESGDLVPVEVEGWGRRAYLDPGARRPRRVDGSAVLSPFDSLVWERSRAERLFGFRYRIELYTPAPKRIYGYYVLPFLLDGALVARVDVRADRARSVLTVPGAYAEPGVPADDIAPALAGELTLLATWLGLDAVVCGDRGDLTRPLAAVLRSP